MRRGRDVEPGHDLRLGRPDQIGGYGALAHAPDEGKAAEVVVAVLVVLHRGCGVGDLARRGEAVGVF